MEQIQCTKCKEWKSWTAFYPNKRKINGLCSHCKNCHSNLKRQWRQTEKGKEKDKETARKYAKKYRKTLTGYLRQHFGRIKQRCNNPNNPDYKHYGGRGIKCLFKNADSYILWVTNILGYDTLEKLKGLEIDRIDNDGHYEVGNIRFVTHKENLHNYRQNIRKNP